MSYILAISSSPSPYSASAEVVEYALRSLKRLGVGHGSVCIRTLPAEALIRQNREDRTIQSTFAQIQQAQGVVIVTQVARGSIAGNLKTYLDLLPSNAFSEKLVLPIVVGAPHQRFVLDYAVKPVLSEFSGNTTLPGLFIENGDVRVEHGGGVSFHPCTEALIDSALLELASASRKLFADQNICDWQI